MTDLSRRLLKMNVGDPPLELKNKTERWRIYSLAQDKAMRIAMRKIGEVWRVWRLA